MPKVGMRIIKSSIAVAVCFFISLFRQEGIVFYSCIAAILCIQQDVANSKKVALNRVKGTLLGGCMGMLVLVIEKSLFPIDAMYLSYLLISFMIIPIIYISVLLNMTSASYISCVVFLSVCVSHGMDVNPYLFACNRIIDTLIGIFVALALNTISFHRYRNQDILFVCDLDHVLCDEHEEMSAYTKVKLKQLLEQGAKITIATKQAPANVLSKIKDIPLSLPMIAMNGACCYDVVTQEYHHCKEISPNVLDGILQVFHQHHRNCFVHTILYQMHHVFFEELSHTVEEDMYHQMRKIPYCHYVCHTIPKNQPALYVYAIHKTQSIQALYQTLKQCPWFHDLHIVIKQDAHPGYSSIEIYHKDARKHQAVQVLQMQYHIKKLIVFGNDMEDLPLMAQADECYTFAKAQNEMLAYANVLTGNQEEAVVRKINQLFHQRD